MLKKRVRVLVSAEPLDKVRVAHVCDLRAEPIPSLAHALNTIECFWTDLTHRLGPRVEFEFQAEDSPS